MASLRCLQCGDVIDRDAGPLCTDCDPDGLMTIAIRDTEPPPAPTPRRSAKACGHARVTRSTVRHDVQAVVCSTCGHAWLEIAEPELPSDMGRAIA